MTNYEREIIEMIPGKTPRKKYENLKKILESLNEGYFKLKLDNKDGILRKVC